MNEMKILGYVRKGAVENRYRRIREKGREFGQYKYRREE